MRQDAADDRPVGDGRDPRQGAVRTPRTPRHVDGKCALEQTAPPPTRRDRGGFRLAVLLPWSWGQGVLQAAVWRLPVESAELVLPV
ncbi:MAG: hypothetical protein OEU26_28805 [Candidatus Tectomicrobia bacterium]|nr:hypothetical protein [Candidatus Tectomicrobia bacterium]